MAPTETQSQGQPGMLPLRPHTAVSSLQHTVNLSSLPIPQLTSIKNQLTQELQHLTNSFTQLRAAQTKFRDCITSIRNGVEKGEKREGTSYYKKPCKSLHYRGRCSHTQINSIETIMRSNEEADSCEHWNRDIDPRTPDTLTLCTRKTCIYGNGFGRHRHGILCREGQLRPIYPAPKDKYGGVTRSPDTPGCSTILHVQSR